MEFAGNALDNVPRLLELRRGALGGNKVLGPGRDVSQRRLDVGALGVASSDEDGVQAKQDPRPTLEEDGRQQHSSPQTNLKVRDNRHREVVVLLDKVSNLVRERVVDLGLRHAIGSRRRRVEDGNQVLAGVRGHVEHGVDRVRKQGERILRREEPDKGHGYSRASAGDTRKSPDQTARLTQILDVLISEKADDAVGRPGSGLCAGALRLVHDDAIRESRGHKRCPVGELGHAAVVVHEQP